jgi:MFS family permease
LCWSAPVEKAITNWFVKKRGFAMGIRWLLSGMLLLPAITFIIDNAGWRWACVAGGATMLCVGMPLVIFCIRDKRPEYYGLLPDGAKPKENSADSGQMVQTGVNYASEVDEIEFTARQAFATPTYWVMVVAQAIYGAIHNAISVHVIPFLTDTGVSAAAAAGMVTITGVFTLGLRFAGGVIIDRVPVKSLRFIFGASYFVQALSLVATLMGNTPVWMYTFLTLNYLGFGMSLMLQSFIWGRYYGRKAFGSIRGFSAIVMIPFAFIAPIYTGWVFDKTGSYTNAWAVMAVICVFAGVLMFFARPPKAPAKQTDVTKII